jgi:ubiquinone/menaquinone biosynthesis C-methylase UbiE
MKSKQTTHPHETLFDLWKRVLGAISGGSVLDVATAKGGFVNVLIQNLQDYTEITGIDVSERFIQTAQKAFEQQNVHFVVMDAERTDFDNGRFDTVTIAISLHHLANIPQVLAEAVRVLKPGGRLVVGEMYRNGLTEPQLAGVAIHHWRAEIDTALGVTHNPTLTRQQIVALIEELGLRDVAFYDYAGLDGDPQDEAAIQGIEGYIDRAIQDAQGLPDYEAFKGRGAALRRRLADVGAQNSPVLIAVGKK